MTYTTITPQARQAFTTAQMQVNEAARAFSGSFATTDALKAASDSLGRAVDGLRDVRKLIR